MRSREPGAEDEPEPGTVDPYRRADQPAGGQPAGADPCHEVGHRFCSIPSGRHSPRWRCHVDGVVRTPVLVRWAGFHRQGQDDGSGEAHVPGSRPQRRRNAWRCARVSRARPAGLSRTGTSTARDPSAGSLTTSLGREHPHRALLRQRRLERRSGIGGVATGSCAGQPRCRDGGCQCDGDAHPVVPTQARHDQGRTFLGTVPKATAAAPTAEGSLSRVAPMLAATTNTVRRRLAASGVRMCSPRRPDWARLRTGSGRIRRAVGPCQRCRVSARSRDCR
jgi:hypothetical protein